MNLSSHLQLNKLFFDLIETQSKIAYYDNRGWSQRKLYQRIEELESDIQELTTQIHICRDAKGRFVKRS